MSSCFFTQLNPAELGACGRLFPKMGEYIAVFLVGMSRDRLNIFASSSKSVHTERSERCLCITSWLDTPSPRFFFSFGRPCAEGADVRIEPTHSISGLPARSGHRQAYIGRSTPMASNIVTFRGREQPPLSMVSDTHGVRRRLLVLCLSFCFVLFIYYPFDSA